MIILAFKMVLISLQLIIFFNKDTCKIESAVQKGHAHGFAFKHDFLFIDAKMGSFHMISLLIC